MANTVPTDKLVKEIHATEAAPEPEEEGLSEEGASEGEMQPDEQIKP